MKGQLQALTLSVIAALVFMTFVFVDYLLFTAPDPDAWNFAGRVAVTGGAIFYVIFAWELLYSMRPHKPEGGAKQQVTKLAVTVQEEGAPYAWGSWMDLQISRGQLTEVAKLLQRDPTFSAARLAGKGKPLSRAEWEHLREAWIERGLVVWVHDRARSQGAVLTPAGRGLVKKLAEGE